jgi:hypothetical protein
MNATPLSGWIEGIGFIAPGLPDWPTLRAVLRGEQPYVAAPSVLPVPAILPAAERRRASRIIKLTLAIGQEAAAHAEVDVSTLATVFSASGADGHNCHAICEQLASDDRQISPTRFHNSVHNAAAGYWGIATHSMAPSQVICAFNAGFGAGIIDTLGQVVVDHQTTLLIAYDSEYPEPLHSKRPVPDVGGIALVISPTRTARSLGRITVTPTTQAAEILADRELEACRNDIPALRCLPLLQKLARGESGTVCVDYLRDMQLNIDLQLC